MHRRGYMVKRALWAGSSIALLLALLAGCGTTGRQMPATGIIEPSASPSLSPPIPGDQPPLNGIPGQTSGGRLPQNSPYPLFTLTSEKIQGDPVNLIFIATRVDLTQTLQKAGWLMADPLNTVTRVKMIRSFLLHITYPTAPVSDMFCFGRVQDQAFEKNSDDTRQRDHFRVWQTDDRDQLNRPIWVGAASRDIATKINPNTGLPTHKIAPNIDAERDLVQTDLLAMGRVDNHYRIAGVGKPFSGTNGSNDYLYSDGMIAVISLKP